MNTYVIAFESTHAAMATERALAAHAKTTMLPVRSNLTRPTTRPRLPSPSAHPMPAALRACSARMTQPTRRSRRCNVKKGQALVHILREGASYAMAAALEPAFPLC